MNNSSVKQKTLIEFKVNALTLITHFSGYRFMPWSHPPEIKYASRLEMNF